jgi:hypothetical protein
MAMTITMNLSRRAVLQGAPLGFAALATLTPGAVAASGVAVPSVLASLAPVDETKELTAALENLAASRRLLAKLEDDLDWPEEILGSANGDAFYRSTGAVIETDILDRPVRRETEDLTKRLSREFRENNERICFVLETPEVLRERIRSIQSRSPRGRTDRTIAKDRARLAKWLGETERALLLSEWYFAETQRLRQMSGVDNLKRRLDEAKVAVARAYEAIAHAPANTTFGLRAKALAYIASGETLFAAFPQYSGFLLAMDAVRSTEPEDGKEWPPTTAALHDTLADVAAKRASTGQ